MRITIVYPPEPGSTEELEDLAAVIKQFHNRVVPEKLQERCDKDMDGMMVEYLANRGAYINLENIKKVKLAIVPVVSKLKHQFVRPRPGMTARRLNIDFNGDYLGTALSPSYPSGHTIQAYVCAEYCSRIHPEYSTGLFLIAELVAQSRIDRGVHFPSDIEYGKLIAKEIADQVWGGQ